MFAISIQSKPICYQKLPKSDFLHMVSHMEFDIINSDLGHFHIWPYIFLIVLNCFLAGSLGMGVNRCN